MISAKPPFSTGGKTFELEELNASHREIHRRSATGQNIVEIAKAMGISRQKVSYTLRCPLGQKNLAELYAERDNRAVDIGADLREFAPVALEVMKDFARNTSGDVEPQLQFRSSRELLHMAGHAPVKRSEQKTVSTTLTLDDITELKRRAEEARTPIDVTPHSDAVRKSVPTPTNGGEQGC